MKNQILPSGWSVITMFTALTLLMISGCQKEDAITLTAEAYPNKQIQTLTLDQVQNVIDNLSPKVSSYVSVFAGRIADTGRDPIPIMKKAINIMQAKPLSELIWASPRELLNIIQAHDIGCHIITVTSEILKKLSLLGYDLEKYSCDTVKMFYKDAVEANFKL